MQPATVVGGQFTATHTTFVLTAGSAQFVLDFLSPISPKDYVRQSYPFSYLTVSVTALSGKTPTVQVYSDIDNSWTGQFGEDMATSWTYATTEQDSVVFTLTPDGATNYCEVSDMAQWGSAVYGTRPNESNLTYQIGPLETLRADFAANGSVTGPWNYRSGSVIGYTHDLGVINGSNSPKNVTFVIGHVREAAINYMGNARAAYW